MVEPVRAGRLSDEEGRRLQQIGRRGKYGSIRVRRALIIMASALSWWNRRSPLPRSPRCTPWSFSVPPQLGVVSDDGAYPHSIVAMAGGIS